MEHLKKRLDQLSKEIRKMKSQPSYDQNELVKKIQELIACQKEVGKIKEKKHTKEKENELCEEDPTLSNMNFQNQNNQLAIDPIANHGSSSLLEAAQKELGNLRECYNNVMVERNVFQTQLDSSKEIVAGLIDDEKKLISLLEESRSEKENLQAECEKQKNLNEKSEKQIVELKKIESTVETLEAEKKEWQTQLESSQTVATELIKTEKRLKVLLEQANLEKDNIEEKYSKCRNDAIQLEKQLRLTTEKENLWQSKETSLMNALESSGSKFTQLQASYDAVVKEQLDLQLKLKKKEQSVDQMTSQMNNNATRVTNVEALNHELEKELEKKKIECETQMKDMKSAHDRLGAQSATISEQEAELAQVTTKLQTISAELQAKTLSFKVISKKVANETEQLRKELDDKTLNFEKLRLELSDERKLRLAVESTVITSTSECTKFKEIAVEISKQNREKEETLERLKGELNSIRKGHAVELKTSQETITGLKIQLSQANAAEHKRVEELFVLKNIVSQLQEKNDDIEGKTLTLADSLKRARQQEGKLGQTIATLKEKCVAKEKSNSDLLEEYQKFRANVTAASVVCAALFVGVLSF